jgi:uncharacterized membrane protein YqjE
METSLNRAPEKPAPNLGDLLEDVLHQSKSLVQAEFSLARRELVSDVKSTAGSLIFVVIGVMFLQAALATLGVLLVMAFGVGVGGAAVVVGLLAVGAAVLMWGLHSLERRKLERTTARLSLDTKQVMETVK